MNLQNISLFNLSFGSGRIGMDMEMLTCQFAAYNRNVIFTKTI
ncbi:MAG TPA: hypothetical protein PKL65_12320 [Bacteroidales bacterium]|nr:hypothetical protein [Bacteroidales bacterium]HQG77427.1 hypothetical protein [Bacteroidales bacterium]